MLTLLLVWMFYQVGVIVAWFKIYYFLENTQDNKFLEDIGATQEIICEATAEVATLGCWFSWLSVFSHSKN